MEQDFTYYAFISYSRKDEAFAKKLQHYIEHYKLPSVLCRKFPHIPKKLRPIFRDATDLSLGQLNEGLEEALAASRHLIVICSENSVRPNKNGKNWIDEEIQIFLRLRPEINYKRIIPIILRQEGGLSNTGCLLPTLRERNILGADVLEKGIERTYSDVIAKMVGINTDALWDRHQREERRKRFWRRIGGGLAAALAAVVGWGYWFYNAEHVSYYTDYVERNNIPEGLFELTEEQVKNRQRHYRFTEHKLRVRKVEYCNSAGTPQEHTDYWNIERPATMELTYRENGELERSLHRNAQGKELTVRKFNGNLIDFTQQVVAGGGQGDVAQSATPATSLSQEAIGQEKSSIGRFFVHRKEEGRNQGIVWREIFCKAAHLEPAKDAQGVGGRVYKRDELGRPIEVRYLAVILTAKNTHKVEWVETQRGIAGYRLSYGDKGLVTSITYINKDGEPVPNEEQWAERRFCHDEKGNLVEDYCLDAAGKLCLHQNGYVRRTIQYDERGNAISYAFYDVNGKPCSHKLGHARVTWRYDERGNGVEATHFDGSGKACRLKDGYARTTYQYDERGNLLEEAYFDESNTPCIIANGYARIACRYDSQGNMIEEALYDTNRKPCMGTGGYSCRKWTYDDRGNVLNIDIFDQNGELNTCKDGYASIKYQYDGRGNKTGEWLYGKDRNPCLHKDGYAYTSWKYNEQGNKTLQEHFDTEGKPCMHQDGYSRVKWTYNEQGNGRMMEYFGTDGQRCMHRDAYSRVEWDYDTRGNVVKETFFGADNKPCMHSGGFACRRWRFDARNNKLEATFYDVDGKPCNIGIGVSRISYEYDDKGNLTELVGYDLEGKEIAREKG